MYFTCFETQRKKKKTSFIKLFWGSLIKAIKPQIKDDKQFGNRVEKMLEYNLYVLCTKGKKISSCIKASKNSVIYKKQTIWLIWESKVEILSQVT